jgi:hypothetical protein
MTDEEMGQIVMVAAMGFFTFFMAMSFYCLWLLVAAPRDPGGMLCDAASPLRSMGAMLRGKHEAGCQWHDKPIQEVKLWTRGSRDE